MPIDMITDSWVKRGDWMKRESVWKKQSLSGFSRQLDHQTKLAKTDFNLIISDDALLESHKDERGQDH
jgi:hypothetical protein